jgi:hypothetical protein
LPGREKKGHGTFSWPHVCNSTTMQPIHEIIDCTIYIYSTNTGNTSFEGVGNLNYLGAPWSELYPEKH